MAPDPPSGRASRARSAWPDHYKIARSGPVWPCKTGTRLKYIHSKRPGEGGGFVSMRNCLSPSSSFRHSADTSQPYFYRRSSTRARCGPLSLAFPSDRCRPAGRLCVVYIRVCVYASYTTWVWQMESPVQTRDSSAGGRDIG